MPFSPPASIQSGPGLPKEGPHVSLNISSAQGCRDAEKTMSHPPKHRPPRSLQSGPRRGAEGSRLGRGPHRHSDSQAGPTEPRVTTGPYCHMLPALRPALRLRPQAPAPVPQICTAVHVPVLTSPPSTQENWANPDPRTPFSPLLPSPMPSPLSYERSSPSSSSQASLLSLHLANPLPSVSPLWTTSFSYPVV